MPVTCREAIICFEAVLQVTKHAMSACGVMSWAKWEFLKQQPGFAYYCAACTIWQHACHHNCKFEPVTMYVVTCKKSCYCHARIPGIHMPAWLLQMGNGTTDSAKGLGPPWAMSFRHGPAYMCPRMCELNAALLRSPSSRQGYVHWCIWIRSVMFASLLFTCR